MATFSNKELDYMKGQRLGRLATADNNSPHVVPVGVRVSQDGGAIEVGGHGLGSSKKYLDLKANPNVAIVIDGRVVAEFVGAQPAAMVSRFLDSLAPSPAELLVAKGDEASLRQAVELEPDRAGAALQLARILHQRGEPAQALEVLSGVHGSF